MFDANSRYARQDTYTLKDRRGRSVQVVVSPEAPRQEVLGYHLMQQGQRLDHIAYHYLDDAAGFWRLCELNNVMFPEMLTEADELAIPAQEIEVQ